MSNVGGFFASKQLPPKGMENPRETIRQFAILWGKATMDAEDKTKRTHTISFRVKYGEEPNRNYSGQKGEKHTIGHYMECHTSGNANIASVMAAVEKGDVVLCVGRTTYRAANTKQGKKWFYRMKVDLIIPSGLVGFLLRLYSSRHIRAMLDKEDREAPDVWES